MFARSMIAVAALMSAPAASAQWVPGSEILGQEVRVQTKGVVNTVRFNPGGTATISLPSGRTVDATWKVDSGKLCMATATTDDCYPYAQPFVSQAPVDLTSDCGALSRWTALSTADAVPMTGERG